MDDHAPKENPPADFNKLDLSQLQGFSFGTQWTQEKPSASPERRDRDQGGERPRRDDRGGGAPDRRDRRGFRKPAGPGGSDSGAPAHAPGGGERREYSGDRGPRQEGGGYRGGAGGEYRGGPRREGGGYGGGPRQGQGGQGGYGGRGQQQDRGPYDSPYYSATFYPEDTSFNTLVQTIRKSCRTVELFEIARTVVAKTDRFVVVLAHKPPGGFERSGGRSSQPDAPAAGESAAPAPKAAKPVFHISVPDGIPFESDEAAVAHVLSKHLETFFDTAEVEVDPPKGNYQVINKCGVTGELLGPPNYHRYNQIVQQHYAAHVASRLGFEAFRSRIETIRDPEVVNQWLAKMKKTTRYTWKLAGAKPSPAVLAAPATPAAAPAATPEASPAAAPDAAPTDNIEPASEGAAAAETAVNETAPAAAAPSTTPNFDTLEDARVFLLTQARDKVVRTSETARFHGKVAETMPPGEIRRAVEGALERQRRFPLDTANALRGRLRREHFTIFKKGSKGVSYVCAVKRKFRVPGQTFSDSIGALISFIETNPMIRASELPSKFLGISLPPAAAPASKPAAAAVQGEEGSTATAPAAAPTPEEAKPETSLSIDERAKLSRMQGDLMWLVREGYVTEFIDGRLFAPPAMVDARKKEIEGEEHDPENFPDVPASAAAEPPPIHSKEPAAPPEAQSPSVDASPSGPDESPTAPTSESAEPAPEAEPAATTEPTEKSETTPVAEPAEEATAPQAEQPEPQPAETAATEVPVPDEQKKPE